MLWQSIDTAISQVEALRFCMLQQLDSSRPPLLPLNDHLVTIANEALTFADKEEGPLMGRLAPTAALAPKGMTLESLTRLRVACMQLLCTSEGSLPNCFVCVYQDPEGLCVSGS